MTLQEIFQEHGIELFEDGEYRDLVDIIEDMYLKIPPREYGEIMSTISEEELIIDIFDCARKGRSYGEK